MNSNISRTHSSSLVACSSFEASIVCGIIHSRKRPASVGLASVEYRSLARPDRRFTANRSLTVSHGGPEGRRRAVVYPTGESCRYTCKPTRRNRGGKQETQDDQERKRRRLVPCPTCFLAVACEPSSRAERCRHRCSYIPLRSCSPTGARWCSGSRPRAQAIHVWVPVFVLTRSFEREANNRNSWTKRSSEEQLFEGSVWIISHELVDIPIAFYIIWKNSFDNILINFLSHFILLVFISDISSVRI